MQPIISLTDVSFSYDKASERALSDVNLSIAPGEFVGVIGPSGAGKSTLAATLCGAIPHHYRGSFYGAAHVDGRDTCEISLTDIARVVGSVAQDIDAQMVASVVEDELLFGLENFGVAHDRIEERMQRALDAAGIADLRHREIATLSGGQKQKVAIAAILALEPSVLVLDEPTAALDPVSSRMVFETLREVNRRAGVTVVVIEQMVALLSEFCGRIVVMDEGRIALDGTPREVFAHAGELRRIGVDSPRVARVYNSLAARGLVRGEEPCLNVAEAADMIERLVSNRTSATGAPTPRASAGAPAPEPAPTPGRPAVAPASESEPAAARPSATAPVVLSVEGASFAYPGGGGAVRDLDLTVRAGELVGVVGQNGAGKTTLTKLVNGLLKPQRGRVVSAGLDTRTTPVSAIAAHVATLFQNPDRQICKETVLDEVAFGLELHGTPAAEARERAAAVIERFGLDPADAPFSLSRGQRQMVALASVVVLDPQLVILDEPTSGLDYRECMTVMETVRDMASRGSAVLMVCHDMEVVSDFAERLAVMADGRILERGMTGAVFADEPLMEAASITPPQAIALSSVLATRVSPRFAGIGEVSHIVSTCEELICHG